MSEVRARFCTKCGGEHVTDARFCTSCGEPVVEIAPPAPAPEAPEAPATPATAEQIHAVIPNTLLKQGFLGVKSKPYILVLTERRVIFAQVTNAMMKQLVADARDDAESAGKGFFGQWGAQLGAYGRFAERYLTMPPDQALAETPGNFALERAAIVSAKLKHGHTDDEGATTPDRLIIKATDRKYDLTLNAGMRQAKEALIAAALI